MNLDHHSPPENWFNQNQLVDFLKDFGVFTHAVTVTLKRVPRYTQKKMAIEAESAVRLFARKLNSHFYGKQFNRGKKCLPMVTCYETTFFGDNPHVHMAVGSPMEVEYEDFKMALIDIKNKINLFNERIDIQPYTSSGWISYITKDGQDSLVPNCCFRSI